MADSRTIQTFGNILTSARIKTVNKAQGYQSTLDDVFYTSSYRLLQLFSSVGVVASNVLMELHTENEQLLCSANISLETKGRKTGPNSNIEASVVKCEAGETVIKFKLHHLSHYKLQSRVHIRIYLNGVLCAQTPFLTLIARKPSEGPSDPTSNKRQREEEIPSTYSKKARYEEYDTIQIQSMLWGPACRNYQDTSCHNYQIQDASYYSLPYPLDSTPVLFTAPTYPDLSVSNVAEEIDFLAAVCAREPEQPDFDILSFLTDNPEVFGQ